MACQNCGCISDCNCTQVSYITLPDGSTLCLTDAVNPNPYYTTVCTGNPVNNMWAEKLNTGYGYRCRLDLMTYEEVWIVLTRVPKAKEDLLKITNDPCLIKLANETKLLVPEKEENDQLQHKMNNSLPYYRLFRGNIDGSIIIFILWIGFQILVKI